MGPTEPRVPCLAPEASRVAGETVALPPAMAELNVFRVLLHHPPLAAAVHGLLRTLLFGAKLDVRLRELAILRIGWATASDYEWTQHWRVALQLGLPQADLEAVRDWRGSDRFDEADLAVLSATDETLDTGTISAATWARLEEHLHSAEERLELVVAIGNWRLFSSMLRSLEIPLEAGLESWPPNGRGPRA